MACSTYRHVLDNQVQMMLGCEVREDLVIRLMQMLLKFSRVGRYETISQGVEEALKSRSLHPGLTSLLLGVCKMSVEFASN